MNYLKRKAVSIPLVILLVVLVVILFKDGKKDVRSNATVVRETLTQEVLVSGTIKPVESVELAFDRSGRVARVYASVGTAVSRGTLLVSLENAGEAANVENALADLKAKEARLAELETGQKPEEIAVKEANLEKAREDLTTYLYKIPTTVSDSYNKADKAVNDQSDQLFSNDRTEPQLSFAVSNQQAEIDAERARFEVEKSLESFEALATENASREENLSAAHKFLLEINSFLLKTSEALNSASNLSDATASAYKESLHTARNSINVALAGVTDQMQLVSVQKILIKKTERELALARSPASTEVTDQAKADIDKAKAVLRSSQATLAKTYLYAPFAGLVTRQDAKTGQIVTASETLVSLMNQSAFIIEADLPEADIAKVTVGDKAAITLDAYGNDLVFESTLAAIDPAEKIVEGVSTYKITLVFDGKDPRVRSGMTANITLVTESKEGVLGIPQRAIFERDGKKYVTKLLSDGTEAETEIVTGIRGENSRVEVVSGLQENDRVLVKTR